MTELERRFGQIVREAHDRFPELDVLRPGGELRLDLEGRHVDRVRLELTSRAGLRLQTLELVATYGLGSRELAEGATVTASSWGRPSADDFSAARLLDPRADGPAFQSVVEERPWLEIALAEPVDLDALVVRSIQARSAAANRDLRVLIGSPGEDLHTVFDAHEQEARLRLLLEELVAQSAEDLRPELTLMTSLLGLTLAGRYPEARAALKAAKGFPEASARTYKQVVNAGFLMDRSLEWTSHGPLRSFRFWSHDEKVAYIEFAVEVADALADLTPNVAFGFGAALAVVRDHDLIPHDDDLDLIIAFEPDEATTLPQAHARVEEFLTARGFTVSGDFFGHRHVGRRGKKKVDVFSGVFEGDRVSWYPGVRRGLTRDTMFPTTRAELLGVEVPLPARPEEYLAAVYGTGWNSSDPGFKHTWRKRDWLDLGVTEADEPAAEPARPARRRTWLDRLRRR